MTAVRRRVVVSGRVHGVGYRESCRHQARQHGVSGWVRNRADGAVEAVFEGEPVGVDALVGWCRAGPRWAEVTDVRVVDEPVEGLSGFVVR